MKYLKDYKDPKPQKTFGDLQIGDTFTTESALKDQAVYIRCRRTGQRFYAVRLNATDCGETYYFPEDKPVTQVYLALIDDPDHNEQ